MTGRNRNRVLVPSDYGRRQLNGDPVKLSTRLHWRVKTGMSPLADMVGMHCVITYDT